MPYTAEISRRNPALLVLLLDQSGSMGATLAGGTRAKAEEAADAINRSLAEIIRRCTKGELRNYFYVGLIRYGNDATSAIPGTDSYIPVTELVERVVRREQRKRKTPDGAGGLVEVQVEFPVWVESKFDGSTAMTAGLNKAKSWVEDWNRKHNESFPPVIMNITDGAATDGDPVPIAKQIMNLSTSDGNALVWNCHISDVAANTVAFPSDTSQLPNEQFAAQLFEMSSLIPSKIAQVASEKYRGVTASSRAYVFNAGLEDLITFLDIGTRGSTEQNVR